MPVSPRQAQESHSQTRRWDSCRGAGRAGLGRRLWVAGGSGSSGEGVGTKGHVGATSALAKTRMGLSLSHLPPTQQPPWHRLQDARAFRTQTQGPLALSLDPQACCRHRQTGVSMNFYYLARQSLIRCSTAGRFLLPSQRVARRAFQLLPLGERLRTPPTARSESYSPPKPKSFLLTKDESHYHFNNTKISLKKMIKFYFSPSDQVFNLMMQNVYSFTSLFC